MWQEIISKAKDTISGEISNKAGLDEQKANQSIELAGDSTREVLVDEAKQGNIQSIMSLFRGQNPAGSGNPISNKISGSVVEKLVSQLGLSPEIAGKVQSIAVPFLLNMVNQKTGGTNSAPSASSLLSLLGGSENVGGDVTDKIKKGLGGLF